MVQTSALTPEEREVLARIVEELSTRTKHSLSFDGLVNEWRGFVASIDQGYDYGVDDYTNDLSCRDLLEEITSRVPTELGEKLRARISHLDDLFVKSTIEAAKPVAGRIGLWWWARVPRKLHGDLESDLRSLGILRIDEGGG